MTRTFATALCLSAALALAGGTAVRAQGETVASLEQKHQETRSAQEKLADELRVSTERQAELEAEVAAVRKDTASVTAALIQAAKTERKLAEDIELIEERLSALQHDESVIRASLMARRDVLAEVLGALQRMGLNPPPAILVRPEDALSSVRSSILLAAVVPELRAETETMLADMRELSRVAGSIRAERERLVATMTEQAAGKQRLSLLLDEKRRLQEETEAGLRTEQERAADIAAKAGNLKDLVRALEKDIAKSRKAAEAARLAEEQRQRDEREAASKPVPEPNRLAVALPFSAQKSTLSRPVAGRVIRVFGQPDEAGLPARGDTLRTQSGAIVTAPADSVVLYAGAFRSYGELLILDTGDGYHVVLSGLGRLSVSLGQALLAGEPVGVMGEARVASVGDAGDQARLPELYVEFRRDQKPVDPAPWWRERHSGRTGHDS